MPGCFHTHIYILVFDERLEEKEVFFHEEGLKHGSLNISMQDCSRNVSTTPGVQVYKVNTTKQIIAYGDR